MHLMPAVISAQYVHEAHSKRRDEMANALRMVIEQVE
jgi:hypothetical protein